jgi:BASS family bile acid:Na+ symporter
MFRLKDFILLLVVFSSMFAGIFFPGFGKYFQPYPQYFLMLLFFLSFLSVQPGAIKTLLTDSPANLVLFVAFKILVLPLAVYYIFLMVAPAYAASALLLSAISTGVTAPFISNVVRGNSALVMVMVVVTSPLVPFTVPALVKLLLARSVEISFIDMIRMLALVIFVPIAVLETLRRTSPRLVSGVTKISYPVSLTLFALINLGVFSKYADFFYQEPLRIIESALVAVVLAALYAAVGLLFFFNRSVEDRIAGAISIGNMNNVLVVVFASHFFSPLEPTVAALYLFPYFMLIIPLRIYERHSSKKIREFSASPEGPFHDRPISETKGEAKEQN